MHTGMTTPSSLLMLVSAQQIVSGFAPTAETPVCHSAPTKFI
jgi:hypothetical protein